MQLVTLMSRSRWTCTGSPLEERRWREAVATAQTLAPQSDMYTVCFVLFFDITVVLLAVLFTTGLSIMLQFFCQLRE